MVIVIEKVEFDVEFSDFQGAGFMIHSVKVAGIEMFDALDALGGLKKIDELVFKKYMEGGR